MDRGVLPVSVDQGLGGAPEVEVGVEFDELTCALANPGILAALILPEILGRRPSFSPLLSVGEHF